MIANLHMDSIPLEHREPQPLSTQSIAGQIRRRMSLNTFSIFRHELVILLHQANIKCWVSYIAPLASVPLNGQLNPSWVRTCSFCNNFHTFASNCSGWKQSKSSAGARLTVINNATWLASFMEAVDKLDLSRTVKHGCTFIILMFLGQKEL